MIYEITTTARYFQQTVINRWNYVSSGVGASVSGAFALADAFGAIPVPVTDVLDVAKPLGFMMFQLAAPLELISCMVAALYDPVDFYEVPYATPKPGGNAGEALSPAAAYGFRTNRVRLDIDRGRKSLAGVVEPAVQAGGIISGGYLTNLANIAAMWSETLEYDDEGNTFTFVPAVLSKEEYTTPSGRRAYRKYSTLAAQLTHTAQGVSWQPIANMRTQRSRQYGHGI
uniref:Uncharacterized protein n=1 Tax=uncultured prokaryote TaxID=198431 RepID=A0A0H5QG37_9ZZZZ|nr:hypothetical protein [uncultured prokaryote]